MKNTVKSLVLAAVALFATHAVAKDGKPKAEANCEIKGKKKAVKDQATCEKDKGKWLVVAAPVAPVGGGTASGSGSPAGMSSGAGSTAPVEAPKK